jgi:hypothetical protein
VWGEVFQSRSREGYGKDCTLTAQTERNDSDPGAGIKGGIKRRKNRIKVPSPLVGEGQGEGEFSNHSEESMKPVRLVYDAEGDILDVDFRLTGERPQQGIELHDNVTLWTDADGTQVFHLMFLSYSKLLEQPALSFTKLKRLSASQRANILKLLINDPVRRFLVCLDEKALRFRVAEPGVREIAAA